MDVSRDHAKAMSFDRRAEQYDALRPGYPDAVLDEILDFSDVGPASKVVEVGGGSGKATRQLAGRGLELVCVEPGANLIEVSRKALPDGARVEFANARFEEWRFAPASFDLVVAAQSFHWIDQEIGYARAGEALRPGGTLALFWNRPRPHADALRADLDRIYGELAPSMYMLWSPERYADVDREIVERICATELFEPPLRSGHPWREVRRAGDYVRLLETHSDHAVLEDAERARLLTAVRDAIERRGGEIELRYECVVHLAQRMR